MYLDLNKVKLAEFLGILTGDGGVIYKKYPCKFVRRIEIALNSTEDEPYIEYVSQLAEDLFDYALRKRIRKDCGQTVLRIDSKDIVEYIISNGIPTGKKRGKFFIPKWISSSSIYSAAFLRGLFDTDGSLFFAKRGTYKKNVYPVIEIKLHDPMLIDQVHELVKKLGFRTVKFPNKVQLNGKWNLFHWLEAVGMNNLNGFSRFQIWEQQGYCPPNTRLHERIALLESNIN